jgi:hypothetical protein
MLLRPIAVSFALLASACATAQVAPSAPASALLPGPKPAAYVSTDSALVGEYDTSSGVQFIIEDAGKLYLLDTTRASMKRTPLPADGIKSLAIKRRSVGPEAGQNQLQVRPVRPVAEVRAEALAASPPAEPTAARAADLVELTSLDPTIKLEIRYATTNNFLGTKIYDDARAFMQRPAAEAVVRANKKLRTLGYGLLIHDAYRPWYVTKIFWDATPTDKRWLVANPAHSRSTCRALMTKVRVAPTPTILAGRRCNTGIARCFATRWSARDFSSIPRSGGTSTTAAGATTRSATSRSTRLLGSARS